MNFYHAAINAKRIQMKKSFYCLCISQKRATQLFLMFTLLISCSLDPTTNFKTTNVNIWPIGWDYDKNKFFKNKIIF